MMTRKRMMCIVVLLSFLLQLTGYQGFPAAALASDEEPYLVVLKKESSLDNFIKAKGLEQKNPKRAINFNIMSVDLTREELQSLQNDTEIAYIERDATVEIASVGKTKKDNDSIKQAAKSQVIPWGIEDIGVLQALAQKIDGSGVKVAVLDTGIAKHPDLRISGGISFVNGTKNYNDDNGHGTHVAGIIAAANNGIGVVGAASKAQVFAVKVLDKYGSGSYGQVIQGIDWAVENGMNIISMSFGGSVESQALHEAIKQASARGILVVAAAGNSGAGGDTILYPARYPEVISVGAVDRAHKRAGFSSTGPELDLVAPGVDILSTTADDGYGTLSGTSMATPHVTGAAAALWSQNRSLTGEEIKQKLYSTATRLGQQNEYGFGLVDLDRALGIDTSPVGDLPVEENTPGAENPSTDQPDPENGFNIINQDRKLLDLSNQLLDLVQRAKGHGNHTLAKNLEKQYNELLQINSELHQVPTELNKFTKEEVEAKIQAENNYYATQADAFQKLENYYQQVMNEFQGQVTSSDVPAGTEGSNENKPASAQGDVDVMSYDFVGNGQTISPGQSATVSLKLFEPKSAVYIRVLNSSGTVITGTTYYNQPANTPIYYTWYTSTSTPVGDYTIRFTYPNVSVVEDFRIYVRSSSSFYTLNLNSPVDVSLSAGQSRVYKFTPSSNGTYKIYTGPYGGYGGSNDTYLELYSDPSLTYMITSNDDANGTLFSEIKWQLTPGTTYYIKLRHYSSSGSVYCRLTATLENTYQPIYYNTPIDVDIPAGGYKLYRFVPPNTANYKVFTGYFGGTSSSGASDTMLYMYSDANMTNQIGYNDDANGTLFSEIKMSMTGGTVYYIKLTGYGGSSVHARITVTVDALPAYTTLYNKTPVDVSKPAGESAYYKFTPSVSGLYRFFTEPYQGTGPENDTYLHLYTDAYMTNQIASNDDVSGGPYGSLFSKIEYNLTAGTTYYIKLRHYSSSQNLYTRFTVEDDFDSLRANATPKSWDEGISDNLSSRYDIDYYRLEVVDNTEDIRLYIDTNAIALEDSNGNTLARFLPGEQETIYSASIPGTYYAKVWYYSGTQSLSDGNVTNQVAAAYNARAVSAWISGINKNAVVATPGKLNKSMSISWKYYQAHPTQVRIYNRDHSVLVYYSNITNFPAGINTITWDGTCNANVEQEAVKIDGKWIARDGNYSVHIIPQDYTSIYFRKDIKVRNTRPVILIGGIGGSVLDTKYQKDDGTWQTDLSWLRATFQDSHIEDRLLLIYNSSTGTVSQNNTRYHVVPRSGNFGLAGISDLAPDAWLNGADHQYEELIADFRGLGYLEGANLFGFPYDWRLNISAQASLLHQKVDSAILASGSSQAIIISHSMGGIVTKEYLRQYTSDQTKIEKWITVGTPHLGAAKAVKALINGYNFDASLIISNKAGLRLAMHSPAVYQLLPSEKYYSYLDTTNYMLYYNLNGSVLGRRTYSDVSSVLSNVHTGAVESYLDFQEGLESTARSIHSNLDTNITNVRMYQIVGDSVLTPVGWMYENSVNSVADLRNQEPIPFVDWGDSTVSRFSADAVGTNNMVRYYYHGTDTHGALPRNANVRRKILNIIAGQESAPVSEITTTFNNAQPLNYNAFVIDAEIGTTMDVTFSDGIHSEIKIETNNIIEKNGERVQVDCYGSKVWVYIPSNIAARVTLNNPVQTEKNLLIYEIREGKYKKKYSAKGKNKIEIEYNINKEPVANGVEQLVGTTLL